MSRIVFNVNGTPGPQGSKSKGRNGGLYESSKKVKPWRAAVVEAATAALLASDDWVMATDAVGVQLTFRIKRPLSHYGTGRNAHMLKDWAPIYCTSLSAGDIDKLQRATYDALKTAGVIADDKLIVANHNFKPYAAWDEVPGATVEVYTVRNAPALAPVYRGQAVATT